MAAILPKTVSYIARKVLDRDEILSLLQEDLRFTAYSVHEVETRWYEPSDWYVVESPQGFAVCKDQRTPSPGAFFSFGAEAEMERLLVNIPLPNETYLTCELRHLEAVKSRFRLAQPQRMLRMWIDSSNFSPESGRVSRLSASHVRHMNDLYRGHINGSVTPQQVSDGIYYGVWEDGRLVSVAGTHFVAADHRIAAVGNVFTHPHYRGRGLAKQCTSGVTQELLESCSTVILSVNSENEPAIRAYSRLGYRPHCEFVEAFATLRKTGYWKSVLQWMQGF